MHGARLSWPKYGFRDNGGWGSMGRPALAAIAGLLSLAAAAQPADPYPSRTVRILVPYAPGGVTDIIARHLAPKLQDALGQPFIVENRPGASGNIDLEAAAEGAPPGCSLLLA